MNDPRADKPLMSHQLMRKKVFPLVNESSPLFFLLIDNLRYDQWKILEGLIQHDIYHLGQIGITIKLINNP